MASARIGALRVDLGLNSAQFKRGLSDAQTGMQRLAKTAKASFAIVATAATAAGAAIGYAFVRTTKQIADMSAEARTAGIAFEEFQKLKYAAEQNLVSVEALTDGLKEMSLRADEYILTGKGSAVEAFQRLGYSVDDLKQKLADPSALFQEIIGRLGALDKAAQIRIADEIFGGTGGEQFVRFLKDGSRGIAELSAEAERLGLVVGGDTVAGAERFQQTMKRMQAVFDGVILKIVEGILPSLDELMVTLSSPGFAEAAGNIATAVVDGMNWAAQAIMKVVDALRSLGDAMNWLGSHDMFGNELEPSKWQKLKASIEATRNIGKDGLAGFNMGSFFGGGSGPTKITVTPDPFKPIIAGAGEAAKAIDLVGSSAGVASTGLSEMQRIGEQVTSTIAGGMTNALMGLIDGTKSLGESIADLTSQLGVMFLNQGFQALFGGFGNLFGGGGYVPGFGAYGAFANGTSFAPGGLALVGERGPELVNLPRGSQVFTNAETRAMMSGAGGGSLHVTVTSEVRNGNLVPVMTQVAGQVAGRVVRQEAPAAVGAYQRNNPSAR